MYDDRKEKFSFKSFFLTLLLVLLFIFLMLWLFPTKSYLDSKLDDSQTIYNLDRLSVLYDEIFANNVERMKDAAIGYFTNERMPQKVGESKKLTLKEMYDLHLVLKMKDKDGNPCDTEKSYVQMTKYTEEYRLKVNLSCGDQEDYIIVYLGCYSYCSNGICEKQVSTPSSLTLKEEKQKEQEEQEKEHNTQDPDNKYSCKVVDGKYYDSNGNIVSKSDYNRLCNVPSDNKHYCEVVDGKYYDSNGNIVSKSEYVQSCSTVSKKYMYEYKKETNGGTTCTAWSNWQKEPVKATDKIKVQTKTEKEIIGYTTSKVKTGTKVETITKKVTEKYIKGYTTELVVVGTKDVIVGSTTKQVTEKVAVGTVEKYYGIDSGTVVPKSTDTVKYKNVTVNRPDSCSNCETETRYTWEIWKVETVYDVVTKNVTVPVYRTINVYEKKEIPVYDYRVVEKQEKVYTPVYEEIKTPQYGDITYYRFKTCETKKGEVSIVWSYSQHDADLIGQGYKLTGNVKQV